MVHGVIYYILGLKTATACTQIGTPIKQETLSIVTKVPEIRSRESVCY